MVATGLQGDHAGRRLVAIDAYPPDGSIGGQPLLVDVVDAAARKLGLLAIAVSGAHDVVDEGAVLLPHVRGRGDVAKLFDGPFTDPLVKALIHVAFDDDDSQREREAGINEGAAAERTRQRRIAAGYGQASKQP